MIYPNSFENKVGFTAIRSLLKERCQSPAGVDYCDSMAFSTDYEVVKASLISTSELVTILESGEDFPLSGISDISQLLATIRIPGTMIPAQELTQVRKGLETIGGLVAFFNSKRHEEGSEYPYLDEKARLLVAFPEIIRMIDRIIDRFGNIKDNASPGLAAIRSQLSATAGTINSMMRRVISRAAQAGYIEPDTNPAIRDGRLVIPVPPMNKRRISGIVHDESASGKTVFIEPAEIVEANNRVRELQLEERREIARILTLLADDLRPHIDEISASLSIVGELDFIHAKALFAREIDAHMPILESKPEIEWYHAVHPGLLLSLRRQGKEIVPLDITLTSHNRILIISGPNAGGKSVCLKTVGIVQYMAQCGILPPVYENSHIGIFSDIFVNIGDDQSIEDDLSTYSSHLKDMKYFLAHGNRSTLVLIDEFGGGTEPQIGGAIAQAILKQFNGKEMWGVITTHFQNLKHFAEDTDGLINGSMLYDRHLMRPMFRLSIGNPGSSFAVEIARKIGLPEDVIADASEIVGSEYINADKYLQDIVRDKRYWEGKRQTIRQREKHMEDTIARYQTEMEELQKSRKEIIRQAKEEAERMLQESNARIENTIRTIKEAQAEKEKTRLVRQELNDFRTSLETMTSKEQEEKIARKMEKLKEKQERKKNKKNEPKTAASQTAATPKVMPITVGENVKIKGQTSIGQVMEINGKNATVAFGSIKTTVKLDRLERSNAAPKTEGIAKSTFVSSQTHDQMYEKKLNFKQDIDVRGMRGDEALQAITYFVDDAILVGMDRVRILHGTGTGILRTLIRQYLSTVPGVSHYADEHVQFGGAGITVVDFD